MVIWSRSSVWRWEFAPYGSEHPGWYASLIRYHSPGWWFGMRSMSVKSPSQRNWLFRQTASITVKWRSLLSTHFFTAPVVWAYWRLHCSHAARKSLRLESYFCLQQCEPFVGQEETLFLWLLFVKCIVIWITRMDQLEVKIRVERERSTTGNSSYLRTWIFTYQYKNCTLFISVNIIVSSV